MLPNLHRWGMFSILLKFYEVGTGTPWFANYLRYNLEPFRIYLIKDQGHMWKFTIKTNFYILVRNYQEIGKLSLGTIEAVQFCTVLLLFKEKCCCKGILPLKFTIGEGEGLKRFADWVLTQQCTILVKTFYLRSRIWIQIASKTTKALQFFLQLIFCCSKFAIALLT